MYRPRRGEAQGKVFEEFYQVDNAGGDRARGLGLGLAIVARLSALLGLSVTLEFEPGRGTTVSLTMPSAAAVAEEEPVDALQGLKVLFIDDEEPVRRAMRYAAALRLRRGGAAGNDEALERTRWPAVPAALISGDTDAERLLEAEHRGLLLHRPVTLERLREAMTSAFGARPSSESDHGE
jgi:hypothetical protein